MDAPTGAAPDGEWGHRGSGIARGAGVDGDGVDASRNQGLQRIIYEPMARQTRQPGKPGADHAHAEVPPLASTRMARMQVTVVLNDEFDRL